MVQVTTIVVRTITRIGMKGKYLDILSVEISIYLHHRCSFRESGSGAVPVKKEYHHQRSSNSMNEDSWRKTSNNEEKENNKETNEKNVNESSTKSSADMSSNHEKTRSKNKFKIILFKNNNYFLLRR